MLEPAHVRAAQDKRVMRKVLAQVPHCTLTGSRRGKPPGGAL